MDKLTCKHCGTKYDAAVGKCPVCGASNMPSISDGFEFLEDDFEAKPQGSTPPSDGEIAAETAPADAAPPQNQDPSVSTDTSRYNWEDIIAEIHGQGDQSDDAPETQRTPESTAAEPAQAQAAAPSPKKTNSIFDPDDDEDEEPVAPKRERKKKSKAGVTVLVVVLAAALLAGAVYGLNKLGVFDKKVVEPETPTLPVEQQDIDCTGVTLSETTLSLTEEGATHTLTVTVEPAGCTNKINWISADPSIATVDQNGVVTAVKEGTVNLLVSCGNFAANCMVTCDFSGTETEDGEGKVGEVGEGDTVTGPMELSATDITMTYPGELARLYVNNSGDKEVTWSTDNETILYVDTNGLITAKASGTAHVYAEIDGEKLECIVRCSLGGEEGQPITVSLNKTDISMFNAGESFQMVVQYDNGTPEGVTHTWESSNDEVCTVDADGVVTAVGSGTAFVSTVADGINLKCIVRVTMPKTSE